MFNILAIIAGLLISPAQAQNTTCATRAFGDSSNACASTAFVHGVGGVGGTPTQLQFNNTNVFGGVPGTAVSGPNITFGGNGDFDPGLGSGVILIRPMSFFGTFGDNATQVECSTAQGSSAVGVISPVYSCLRTDSNVSSGSLAFSWPSLNTVTVTQTTPNPGLAQHVASYNQFVRLNYAAGGYAVNPEGWGSLSANDNFTGTKSSVSNHGLTQELDQLLDEADDANIRNGVVLIGARAAIARTPLSVTGVAGQQTYSYDPTVLNFIKSVTVDGVARGFSFDDNAGTVTLVAPAIINGQAIIITGVPPAQHKYGFTVTSGDPTGGFGPNYSYWRGFFNGEGPYSEGAFDLRRATPKGGAHGAWFPDLTNFAWNTSGTITTLFDNGVGQWQIKNSSTTLFGVDLFGNGFLSGSLAIGSPLGVIYGGTSFASYTTGDLLYASGTTALSKLADVATGNALISGGIGVAPSWGKIGISTHVSGLGTGIATALATNTGSAGAPVLLNGAGGTPSSIVLTNATNLGPALSWTPTFTCAVAGTVTATASQATAKRYPVNGTFMVIWTLTVTPSAQSGCSYMQATAPTTPNANLDFIGNYQDKNNGDQGTATITPGATTIVFHNVANGAVITTGHVYTANGWYLE